MLDKQAALQGRVTDVAGVAATTAAEKLELQFTNRPNSYVSASTNRRRDARVVQRQREVQ